MRILHVDNLAIENKYIERAILRRRFSSRYNQHSWLGVNYLLVYLLVDSRPSIRSWFRSWPATKCHQARNTVSRVCVYGWQSVRSNWFLGLPWRVISRTQSLNVLPLKPGVGQYIAIHATLTARNFFLAYFYSSGPFTCIFSKTSPDIFLCWLWPTPVPV